MKRLLLVMVLLVALVGVVSADTLIVYTTNATDGNIYQYAHNTSYTTLRNAGGNAASATGNTAGPRIWSDLITDTYYYIYRSHILFDTSVLPDDAIISSGLIGLSKDTATTNLGDTGVSIVNFTIDGTITSDDYNNFGTTLFSPYQNVSTLTAVKYYNFSLNAVGLENITKTGITGFGTRLQYDIENITPVWASNNNTIFAYYTADSIVKKPYLEITYTIPDATPPDSITNLVNQSLSCNTVDFSWTNPADADYGGLMVWQNNTALSNLPNSSTFVNWTGLPGDTDITFSSKTVDLLGNINATFVNMTKHTETCGLAPVAAFAANNLTSCSNVPIVFTDSSTNTPTGWSWAFINATVGWTQFSADQNPTREFGVGTYSINLTASNAYGSDDEVKNSYISVLDCGDGNSNLYDHDPIVVTNPYYVVYIWRRVS